ncbi:hypothetical protein D3C83_34720 [compost metagenome]
MRRKKITQEIPGACRRKPPQRGHGQRARLHLSGSVQRAQFIEQLRGIRKIARRSRQDGTVGRIARCDRRQHIVPQKIAQKIGVGVAFVLHPFEFAAPGMALDLAARHIEQRPENPGSDE